MLAIDVGVMVRFGIDSVTQYAGEISLVVAWTLGGFLATRLRPGNRMGTLMIRAGFILALNLSAGDHLANRSWPLIAMVTVASMATPVQWAVGIQTALAFPSGELRDRTRQRLVRAAYVWSLFGPVAFTLGHLDRGCASCASRFGFGLLPPAVNQVAIRIDPLVFVGLVVAAFWVYGRHFVAAGARRRRVLAYPTVGLLLTVGFAVALLIQDSTDPVRQPFVPVIILGLEFSSAAALPLGFLLGLLRDRLNQARVSDLIARLATTPIDELSSAVAHVLGDPDARLVFAAGDGHVDARGQPAPAGPSSRLMALGEAAAPVAYLLHDHSLDSQPELLAGAGAAVTLALDNAKLRAELLAQLADVRASRERLVEAGDNERRRLERNLHDGAQQRLISLGLSLRLIRQRIPDADSATLALFEETESQTREAIRELRDLARGIHPAVLTEQGLAGALEQLANRCPVRVELSVDPLPALPPAIAVTAFYIASEALANVAKHAAASRAVLGVTTGRDTITLSIADDGTGNARAEPGSGLAGLLDRVAAVGGVFALDSPSGGGTRITVELPTAERA
jgi:signal transduction histidine kinase